VLVDHAAAGFACKALPLRAQKGMYVPLCVQSVFDEIHAIIPPVALVKALDPIAGKTVAFKAPLKAFLKRTSLFRAVPAALARDFIHGRPATRA